jgi:hypothetical protein
MLSQAKEELINLEVVDGHENNQGGFTCYEKTLTFPSKILIKGNVLVKLYVENYNIADGLVNGVDGTLKVYTKKTTNIDVVWIEFADPSIG